MIARSSSWLNKKKARLPIGVWLMFVVLALGGVAIYSIFFVRRDVLDFRPEHSFSVGDPAFFGSVHALGDPVPIGGNKITLLHNGDEIFPALLEAIAGAKRSVNFEAFLFESGTVASQFRDALNERARAGVRVRVLLDGVGSGSKLDNDDVKALERAGCHFAYYHPTRSWRIDNMNRRTHRRILVVDGKVGFTGGVGFADLWQGKGDGPKSWRDVHARIEGPLVAKMQGAFQQHWARSFGEIIGGPDEFPELPAAGPLQGQMIASHSFSLAGLQVAQAVAIAAAEKRISITNPYCTPSEDQVALLLAAVKRGVEVRLLLPGKHNDQPWTKAAGRGAYGKLLAGGVKIFEYQPGMIHSKTLVVDGLFSMFGSSNLDARSSAINEELDITIYDPSFGAEMERVFDTDLSNAAPYTLEEFQQRSLWERTSEWVMIPFRSQL